MVIKSYLEGKRRADTYVRDESAGPVFLSLLGDSCSESNVEMKHLV